MKPEVCRLGVCSEGQVLSCPVPWKRNTADELKLIQEVNSHENAETGRQFLAWDVVVNDE